MMEFNRTEHQDQPDLIALALHLTAPEAITLASNQHRAVHHLFLRLVEAINPALAEELKQPNQPRPFTVSNIFVPEVRPRHGFFQLSADQSVYIRLTGLNRAVVEVLEQLAEALPLQVVLDDVQLEARSLAELPKSQPIFKSRRGTYQSILEKNFYLYEQPTAIFRFHFHSPTLFKTEGQYLPVPLPRLVFGSLLHRWNSFSPGPLPDDTTLFAQINLRLARFQLDSRIAIIDEQRHTGFTGTVEFRANSRDRFYLQTLGALAAFSSYSGVGYHTSAGLGQVEAFEVPPFT